MRVLLISVDGMRPDAIGDIKAVQNMKKRASFTMNGKTVMPSVTLPCHMSLFHSVPPSRHGTTTNTYMPQVRPVKGLCEVLVANDKKSAFFYSWEQLKDLSQPGSLTFSYFCKGKDVGYDKANDILTDAAMDYIKNLKNPFVVKTNELPLPSLSSAEARIETLLKSIRKARTTETMRLRVFMQLIPPFLIWVI